MAAKRMGSGAAGAFLALLFLLSPSSAAGEGAGLIRLDFTLRPRVETVPGFMTPGRCPEAFADDIVVCGRRVRGAAQRVMPRARQEGDRVRGEPMMASDVIDIGGIGCSTVGTPYDCGRVDILAVAVRAATLIYRKVAGVPDEQPDWRRLTAEMIPLDR